MAEALGVSVLEIMQTNRNEKNGCSEKDAVELMKFTAEVAMKNRKHELTATVLAAFTIIVVGVLSWVAGFGNFGGSFFFGAIVSVAEVGIYYYMDGRDDADNRKIYAIISCIVIVIIGLLMIPIVSNR